MAELTIIIAFIAGLASFFSPCVLPLVPAFLTHLAGNKTETTGRAALVYHSFLFVLGFSIVFSLLGALLGGVISKTSHDAQLWIGRAAGALIIFFGLNLLGLARPSFLQQEHKLIVKKFWNKSLTSLLFGAAFAAGWTPCIGAVLASILALAASVPSESALLLFAFSLGLGAPFIAAGIFAKQFLSFFQKNPLFSKHFNTVVGIALVILGTFVLTGRLALLTRPFFF